MPRERWPLALSKLGVRDRTRAVLKAFELQLV
jgi:DNA-binding NarL/FixJ family response regulator